MEKLAQGFIPTQVGDVEEQRAAGIGRVAAVHQSSRQPVDQVSLDGSHQGAPVLQPAGNFRLVVD